MSEEECSHDWDTVNEWHEFVLQVCSYCNGNRVIKKNGLK